jgi:hypothetical protein
MLILKEAYRDSSIQCGRNGMALTRMKSHVESLEVSVTGEDRGLNREMVDFHCPWEIESRNSIAYSTISYNVRVQ